MDSNVNQVQASIQAVNSLVATAVSRYTDLVTDLIAVTASAKAAGGTPDTTGAQAAPPVSQPGVGENIDLLM